MQRKTGAGINGLIEGGGINIKKSKFLIIKCVFLCLCLTLSSCRNITVRDFGVNDIANILDVLLKGDDENSPDAETEEATEGFTEDFIDTTEATGAASDIPPGSGDMTNTADTAPTTPEIITTTEKPTETTTETTTEKPTERPPGPAANDLVGLWGSKDGIPVTDVYPGIPDKFKGVNFPESLQMVDSLRRNIRNLADFSSKDFAGMDFFIGTADAMLFTPKEYGGGMLNDARLYRTRLVDAECNTVIKSVDKPREDILQEIRKNNNAGNYLADIDILCVPFDIQSELIKSGLLMNLNKIPFLNMRADYYNASATESLTVNGNVYGLVSDLTFNPSNIYAVFYNKTLVKRYNLTGPLELYKNGGWDYDGMFKISKEFTASIADLNDDLRWSIGFDKENSDLVNGLFISSGNKYFLQRDYALPALHFNNDRTLKLIAALTKIISPAGETGMENYLTDGEWNQNKAFSNGNVLFSITKLDIIPGISNIDFDWGILPVPKLDGEGKYYSFTDRNAMCVSVPNGAKNTEACGVVINALSLASYRQLQDIYVSEQMMYRLRDVDSVKTLADIVGNTAYNHFTAFSTIPEFYGATVGILKDSADKTGNFQELYKEKRAVLYDFFGTTDMFNRK